MCKKFNPLRYKQQQNRLHGKVRFDTPRDMQNKRIALETNRPNRDSQEEMSSDDDLKTKEELRIADSPSSIFEAADV